MMHSKEDYELMSEAAIDLRIDYGFLDKKLDVFELAKKIGISLVPYSSLKRTKKGWTAFCKLYKEEFKDGFTIIEKQTNGEWNFLTFFDDSIQITRQRFTIAHEIKHVIFREENPSQKDEELADFFARHLLVPPFLLDEYVRKNAFPDDVSFDFGVSYEVANYALNNAIDLFFYNIPLKEWEIRFINLMKRK